MLIISVLRQYLTLRQEDHESEDYLRQFTKTSSQGKKKKPNKQNDVHTE